MSTPTGDRVSVGVGSPLVVVCLFVLLAPSALHAQTPSGITQELLRDANGKVAAGQLLEAERLYRLALEKADDLIRPRCLEALISLNVHLGRHEQAIRYALPFQEGLRKDNDLVHWREATLQLGESYLALGHYRQGEQSLEDALALTIPGRGAETRLPAPAAIAALARLAQSAEKRGDRQRAGRFWRQVEELALAQLEKSITPPLAPRDKIQVVWKLAEASRFQKQPDRAILQLKNLLTIHDQLEDVVGQRATLRMLAGHYTAARQDVEAETCLRQALDLRDKVPEENRLAQAELWNELAEVCNRQHRRAEADRCRDQAADLFTSSLREPRVDRRTIARTTTAFWKLQQIYQKQEQPLRALHLIEEQTTAWGRDAWMSARLKAEKGSLQLFLGEYARARQSLTEAVDELEKQTPLNLIDLPSALLSLGIVEQAAGSVESAETHGNRCLALYREHGLPDDATLAETCNLLGSCLAVRGRYAEGIEHFRRGVACCEKLGVSASVQHSNLLLNIALLHRAQGDLEEALRYCVRARELCKTVFDSDSLEMASFLAALADLHATRGHYREADALAEPILKICASHQVSSGLLVVTARHCQALFHLYRREFNQAEEGWRKVLEIQEKEKYTLLMPRTLNFLGVAAEMQGSGTLAEKYYRRALALQQESANAFPATHFITLWRLANLAERQGQTAEALVLLEQGMALVEKVRLRTYGDAQQRATFFAQFTPAFEQLVDWSIKSGQLDEAFLRAARTRSRTLVDQLQLAGADPREALRGPVGKQLLEQEKTLREQLGAIRARASFLSVATVSQDEAKTLSQALEETQHKYAEVWREILNANPAYRNVAELEHQGRLLTTIREKVLGPRNLLLVYHFGTERSHVLLVGDKTRPTEVFPLTVPSQMLNRLVSTPSPARAELGGGDTRGVLVKPVPRPPAVVKEARLDASVPLTHERARFLIDTYRQQLEDPNFQSGRGVKIVPEGKPEADPPSDLDNLADVFVPAAVRQRIKDSGPDHVVVVPDGALHKMPLEALPLKLGLKARYLLDELPPLVYAPSATTLAMLAERPRVGQTSIGARDASLPLSILTVSNPAYPQPTGKENKSAPGREPAANPLLGLRGQLPLLPATAEESRRIQQFFEPKHLTALEGAGATEEAVVKALARRPQIVHLAVHGFADDRLGNLFGALALAPPPPGQDTVENDGFLSLHEIYTLPLQDCELAVLSACDTNAGPQRPLEAGVTLAGAFLAAGARHVVASHWSVDDQSTAELMSVFFTEVTAPNQRRESLNYADALQKARMKVRNNPRWASPFYWAPFVFIGPPETPVGR
jgi:CHAT domain-containing protein/tetratricopeptide (TPR) repeat protein